MSHWHKMDSSAVLEQLRTELDTGLKESEVAIRLQKYGTNELAESGGRSPLRVLWDQLRGALVALLVAAAVISIFLEEYIDAGAILTIILLNAILGFVQDYRAEKALAALKKLAVPTVRVRRESRLEEVSARVLVPGDIIQLEAGNYVPADCRLLESVNLKAQESALTGESEAVEKQVEPLDGDSLPLGDRTNMAYMGTVVTYGHGQAVITETGMTTELGCIAQSLRSVKVESTPLQKRLAQLGRTLALVTVAIVAALFLIGLLYGKNFEVMLMTALSMAVAIVPEGLPAVATVTLAIGARRMFRRNALIRKLPAVETLGSVTFICSDKTGTLTENRMTVTVLDVAGARFDLANVTSRGELISDQPIEAKPQEIGKPTPENSSLAILLAGAGLCNDAELECDSSRDSYHAIGDPTEGAIAVAAARMQLPKTELVNLFPRVNEIPFDSERKRMTTLHGINGSASERDPFVKLGLGPLFELTDSDQLVFTKGAVDQLLDVSQFVWVDDQPQDLDEAWRNRIQSANDELAAGGMRVLGVAFRPIDASASHDKLERELIFVGLLGMIDPPRAEVKEAVARCRSAGIRPVMITGDHPLTALHVAQKLDIADKDSRAITGTDLAGMSVGDLEDVVEKTSVYARVAPKDKLRIVQALQNCGHVVAMTGDGVNDAPALKQAHIGVAMGVTGTDVSKEASEMVLLDDNFETIVNAVEEGRIVYDNIRKFVRYTMTSNAGEIWVMVLGPLMGMPLPLIPLQILWVNLVTDGLPGLAYSVEPAEDDTMRRPPVPPKEHIFGGGMAIDIAWVGLLMGVISLAFGYFSWSSGASIEHWRTIVFTVLTLSQMGNALAIRAKHQSLLQIGLLSNKALLGSVLLTFVLQMMVIYLPPLQTVFQTTALSVSDLLICMALSSIVFLAVEGKKLVRKQMLG